MGRGEGHRQGPEREGRKGADFSFMVKTRTARLGLGIGDKRAGFPMQIPPLIRKTAMPQTDQDVEGKGRRCGDVEILPAVG